WLISRLLVEWWSLKGRCPATLRRASRGAALTLRRADQVLRVGRQPELRHVQTLELVLLRDPDALRRVDRLEYDEGRPKGPDDHRCRPEDLAEELLRVARQKAGD